VTDIAKLVYVDPMTLQYLLSLRRQIDSDLTLVISNNLIWETTRNKPLPPASHMTHFDSEILQEYLEFRNQLVSLKTISF